MGSLETFKPRFWPAWAKAARQMRVLPAAEVVHPRAFAWRHVTLGIRKLKSAREDGAHYAVTLEIAPLTRIEDARALERAVRALLEAKGVKPTKVGL
jgi:hypothetical protein